MQRITTTSRSSQPSLPLTDCADRACSSAARLRAKRHAAPHRTLHASCSIAAAAAACRFPSVAAQVALAGLVLIADVAAAWDVSVRQAAALVAGVAAATALPCTVTGAHWAAHCACKQHRERQCHGFQINSIMMRQHRESAPKQGRHKQWLGKTVLQSVSLVVASQGAAVMAQLMARLPRR